MLAQHFYNGIAIGAIYALIAVGITLVYGLSRIIHFAVGELVMLGAYVAWAVHERTGNYWAALAAATLALAIIGLITERTVFRFTLSAPLTGFIVSLGLILILQGAAVYIWTANPQYVQPPFQGSWDLGGFIMVVQTAFNISLVVALLLGCYALLMRTRWGKALRAVSDDRGAAALMGVPVRLVITGAFVGGAALAGVAGWLILTNGSITPFVGENYLLRGFAVALIGGLGNIPGAAIAGLGLGIAESMAAGYVSPGWNDAYVFGAMIIVLLWRPTGLAGGGEGAKI
jgi:branched-chain amino acid transport system permease protein